MSAPVVTTTPQYEVVPAQNVPAESSDDSPNGGAFLGVGAPIIPKLGTGGFGVVFEGLGTIAPRVAFGIHVGGSLLGSGDASAGSSAMNGYEIDALLVGELLAFEHGDFRAFVQLGAGVMKTKPGLADGYQLVDGDAISLAMVPTVGVEVGRVRATVAYALRPGSSLSVAMPPSQDYATWSGLHFVMCALTVRLGGVPPGV